MKNLAVLVLSLIISGSAFAWKPTKNITMVVPFPPGSGNDLIARSVSESVSRTTGVTIVIENKAGAGGTVGMMHLNTLPNDGHSVSLASMGKSPSFSSIIFTMSGGNIRDSCDSSMRTTAPCPVGT